MPRFSGREERRRCEARELDQTLALTRGLDGLSKQLRDEGYETTP